MPHARRLRLQPDNKFLLVEASRLFHNQAQSRLFYPERIYIHPDLSQEPNWLSAYEFDRRLYQSLGSPLCIVSQHNLSLTAWC